MKIEARLDTADATIKTHITKLEVRLTRLELGGTANEDGARGQVAAHAVSMAGWKPCHNIMGGWARRSRGRRSSVTPRSGSRSSGAPPKSSSWRHRRRTSIQGL